MAELRFVATKHGHRPVRVGLYLDEDNVMRCKRRINNSSLTLNSKQPILLPHDDSYVKLLVLDAHQQVKHS